MPAPLLAPLIAVVALAAVAGVLRVQRSRQRRLVGLPLPRGLAGTPPAGLPDILYFTGENCTVCEVAQRPALKRLRELIDDVAIREIDVAHDRGAARSYRVMTLPTTVVLDPAGRATVVNAGFAGEAKLREQVLAARAVAPDSAVA
jgi:hypothetical protein